MQLYNPRERRKHYDSYNSLNYSLMKDFILMLTKQLRKSKRSKSSTGIRTSRDNVMFVGVNIRKATMIVVKDVYNSKKNKGNYPSFVTSTPSSYHAPVFKKKIGKTRKSIRPCHRIIRLKMRLGMGFCYGRGYYRYDDIFMGLR